ncbi:hypothetical protein DIPPA_07767 [Diplonema papillatum]|nr:hypothetical protein DIPPA_07749 [Diplonema papillatum]KAJ9463777.1 hypothetical protein DIPPA_07767 [Diplonema papillatum]
MSPPFKAALASKERKRPWTQNTETLKLETVENVNPFNNGHTETLNPRNCNRTSTLKKQVVFAGTPSGQIAVYPFPIVGPAPCLVLDAHTKPVIFVVLSVDERLLITVSEDLSL